MVLKMIPTDTTYLSRRYKNSIPHDVREGMHHIIGILNARKEHVQEVVFLENFSKDLEQSIVHASDIYKGLVVKMKPEFKFEKADIAWLHPNFAQVRAVYPGGEFDELRKKELDLGSSCGTYSVAHEDDIGTLQMTRYTIVDMHIPNVGARIVKDWLRGSTVKEAYEQYLTAPLKGYSNIQECAKAQCNELSEDLNVTEEAIQTWFTNVFHRDSGVIQFSNHSIVENGKGTLIQISPLYGYMMVKERCNVPSDLMSKDDFVNVSELKESQVQRIFSRCHWGESAINSTALRKPIPNWGDFFSGQRYKMEEVHFASSEKVTPLMDPKYLHTMSALSHQIDKGRSAHHYEDKIQVVSSDEMIAKLLAMGKNRILNPDFYNEGHLYLPREWIKELS